jgi:hypothetical protein
MYVNNSRIHMDKIAEELSMTPVLDIIQEYRIILVATYKQN